MSARGQRLLVGRGRKKGDPGPAAEVPSERRGPGEAKGWATLPCPCPWDLRLGVPLPNSIFWLSPVVQLSSPWLPPGRRHRVSECGVSSWQVSLPRVHLCSLSEMRDLPPTWPVKPRRTCLVGGKSSLHWKGGGCKLRTSWEGERKERRRKRRGVQ